MRGEALSQTFGVRNRRRLPAALVTAGGELSLTASTFANSAGIDTYDGDVFAGGGGHRLIAYGQSAATVQAGGTLTIAAGASSNTGTLTGNSVWLGGSLVNGLTDYNQPTPATTLPQASIDLTAYAPPPAAPATPAPAAAATPVPAALPPTLPGTAQRLALLAPVAQDTLLALLPAELRPGAPVFAL
ncbi:MAG: hypothetical protein C0522_13130, partial [Rhodocyclaceae bacterium]|nr:hypothetical protein [Rhodocyclaceae bacterium]